jgi:hypothetical protein
MVDYLLSIGVNVNVADKVCSQHWSVGSCPHCIVTF